MQPISTPSSSSAAAAAVEKPELEAVEEPVEKIARDAIAGGACSSSSSSIADSHLVSILSPADQLSPEQNMIIRDHLEKLVLSAQSYSGRSVIPAINFAPRKSSLFTIFMDIVDIMDRVT